MLKFVLWKIFLAKVKTYITDYDIRETLGEGSFGAVSIYSHVWKKKFYRLFLFFIFCLI